jgi:hypothetical protein
MWSALLVVASYVAVAMLGGWGFFRRYRVVGPPLGVVNLADVAIMLAFIVVVPYLFLTLPLWAVALVFGVAVLSALYSTLVPMLPLFPMIAWPIGAEGAAHAGSGAVLSRILGVGLGDVLLATVFPLTMRKAFGRAAGLVAMAVTLVAVVGALVLLSAGLVTTGIPLMSFLGPLMVAQYAYWRRTRGGERTVAQYLQAEPWHGTPEPT